MLKSLQCKLYNTWIIKINVCCTVNLATALKCVAPNKDVGLLDADVFGPSIPLMMDLHETPLINDGKIAIPCIWIKY